MHGSVSCVAQYITKREPQFIFLILSLINFCLIHLPTYCLSVSKNSRLKSRFVYSFPPPPEIQLEPLSFWELQSPRLRFSLLIGQVLVHCLRKLLILHYISEVKLISYHQLIHISPEHPCKQPPALIPTSL